MMMKHQSQRGLTFIGLLFVGILVALTGIVVAQVVPTYTEFMAVQKAVNKSASGETVAEVRSIFDKQATIDYITSISSKDLEVGKEGNKVVVSFSYERDVPLFGPAYLVMRYKGSSK